ncbi:MAG: DEAD/DEAH box helicase [Nitrososphaerales archaeon]
MRIREIPIPRSLADLLEEMGYVELYPPQEEAVKRGVLQGESVLLTTPTASGKTLVALLAAGKRILEDGCKVVYLTPLRALAAEKFEEFKILESLVKPNGSMVNVRISTGDYDSSGEFLRDGDLLILTNERFDSILRHGASWLDDVKLYVADEVHLVGSPRRGATLESILTKIRAFSADSQIIGLSATITNGSTIARWLNAELININWRPVKLVEGVWEHGRIIYADGRVKAVRNTGRGAAIDVAADVLEDGGQALIFADTRRRAVSLASKASEVTKSYLTDREKEELDKLSRSILTESEETSLSRALAEAVQLGSAFHHAGLAPIHRRIVEEAYRKRLIKILVATPTLAAGVNLPARRVVISSLYRYDAEYGGQNLISVLEYKQMCGRAGRPKFDEIGETILVASPSFTKEELFENYIKGEPEPITSQLAEEGTLRTHLLATVASIPGLSDEDIEEFFSNTLFALQYRRPTVKIRLSRCLEKLLRDELIVKVGKRYMATEFGKRISLLYIDPETGVLFKRALQRCKIGRRYDAGFIHLISIAPDMSPRLGLRSKDTVEAREYIEEHYDEFLIEPYGDENYIGDIEPFRNLLVLDAWIREASEDTILEKYGVEPGDLYRITENGEWLLYSLKEIAKMLQINHIVDAIEEMRLRVKYGVRAELLPLTKLEGIGRVRARALYSRGFTDLSKLASAKEEQLSAIPKIGLALAKKIKKQVQNIL